MDQCGIYCISTGRDALADVLERSDKRIKVALVGTDITITLTRQDGRAPYIGHAGGLEFETFGGQD